MSAIDGMYNLCFNYQACPLAIGFLDFPELEPLLLARKIVKSLCHFSCRIYDAVSGYCCLSFIHNCN